MINFKKWFDGAGTVAVEDMINFVDGDLSLNQMRQYWKESPEMVKIVYQMERHPGGVKKTRQLARRALNRRGVI